MDFMIAKDLQPVTSWHITAVVVNWNRPSDTIACVQSLLEQKGIDLHIIIVDNGSTDNSVRILRDKFPNLELINYPVNLKFGRGYNLGIRRALQTRVDDVFIINNDAILDPHALALLCEQISSDVGILSPLIYYADPPNVIWSIGGKLHPLTLERSSDSVKIVDQGDWPSFIEQDFVTGCGMLLTHQVLEEVGLFDETFEHYYEDMDYCRRVRKAGFRILVVPQAKMWHKIAMSSGGSDSPVERYWMARSSVRYFHKHGRGWQILAIVPYRLGSAFKTTISLVVKKRGESVRAYWRGLMDGLRENFRF
jgi:GT2 family glycosyltransferase